MIRQKHTTWTSRYISSTVRENKPRERVKIQVDQDIRKTDKGRSRGIVDQVFSSLFVERMLVDQEEGERSTIWAEYGTFWLEPFSRRQPSRCCWHPIRRNLCTRGLNDWRSPLCTQYAHTRLLDFDATFHVTPNIEWFLNYTAPSDSTTGMSAKSQEPEKSPFNFRMEIQSPYTKYDMLA